MLLIISGNFLFAQNVTDSSEALSNQSVTKDAEFDEAKISLNLNNSTQTAGTTTVNTRANGALIFFRMLFSLAFVILLIWIVFKFMKRSVNGKTVEDDPFLRKAASLSLGQGKAVHVITLIDKAYIVGASENGVNLIAEVKDEQLINALNLYSDKTQETNKPKNFDELLGIFMGKKNPYETKQSNEYAAKKSFFSNFLGFNLRSSSVSVKKNQLDEETANLINSLKSRSIPSEENQENDVETDKSEVVSPEPSAPKTRGRKSSKPPKTENSESEK